jgi:hypothetical protein
LSRNVGKELPQYAAQQPRRAQFSLASLLYIPDSIL